MALDVIVKNVVNAYSLEHRSIDELFDSIFQCLDVLIKGDGEITNPFQELGFCIAKIQAIICQHMLKEEEHVCILHSSPAFSPVILYYIPTLLCFDQ